MAPQQRNTKQLHSTESSQRSSRAAAAYDQARYQAHRSRRELDETRRAQAPHAASSTRRPHARSSAAASAPKKPRLLPIALAIVIVALIVCAVAIVNCSGQGQQAGDAGSGDSQQAQAESPYPVRSEAERSATSASDNSTKPSEHVVYLTFDDGPSTNTHKILDILDSYGVKATWFVIGNRGHLDYIKDIWDDGNQVALHSDTHEYTTDYKSANAYFSGLDKLSGEVEKILGFKPTLFRFPGGSVNGYDKHIVSDLKNEAASRQWHYFDWNVSSGDAGGNDVPVDTIVNNIKTESAGNNSCCVLMHDTEAKNTTVEALPQIIEYYQSEGYTFDVLTADSFGYHF